MVFGPGARPARKLVDSQGLGCNTDMTIKLTKKEEKLIKDRNEALFAKLVPEEGTAGTVEGEMLRAVNRIMYRFSNDGDFFWDEPVRAAHAYLVTKSPLGDKLAPIFEAAYMDHSLDRKGRKDYEAALLEVLSIVVHYVEEHEGDPTPNMIDMWDVKPLYQDTEEREDDY